MHIKVRWNGGVVNLIAPDCDEDELWISAQHPVAIKDAQPIKVGLDLSQMPNLTRIRSSDFVQIVMTKYDRLPPLDYFRGVIYSEDAVTLPPTKTGRIKVIAPVCDATAMTKCSNLYHEGHVAIVSEAFVTQGNIVIRSGICQVGTVTRLIRLADCEDIWQTLGISNPWMPKKSAASVVV